MKKRSCVTLALILVMVQVISLFAIAPVTAAEAKNYGLIKSTETMTVDGKADEAIWAKAEWSEKFEKAEGTTEDIDGFTAQYKAVWSPVAGNDSMMNIHILVVTQGQVNYRNANYRNHIRIRIETADGTQVFRTGMKKLDDDIINGATKPNFVGDGGSGAVGANTAFQMNAVNDISASKSATYEFSYQMPKSDSIKLDVLVGACPANWGFTFCSWAGMSDDTKAVSGIGTILDTSEAKYSIDITKTTETITIDGIANESAWATANASAAFQNVGTAVLDGFTGSFKALWSPVEGDETMMNLYIFVTASGHVTWRNSHWSNVVRIQVECADGTQRFWTGMKKLDEQIISNANKPNLNGGSSGGFGGTFRMDAVNDIANSGTATYEFCYQLPKADTIKLDVYVGGCNNDWQQAERSWAGMTSTSHANAPVNGVANIVDTVVETPVEVITTTPGASIRLDTETPELSGIRFANSVNMEYYNKMIAEGATIQTGTLIVPTKSLTVKGIADADFTKEALLAAGLTEDVHFYDVVNENNEWVEGKEGTWYATLYDIQNFNRQFSSVGYVTVTVDGETTTYYGDYQSTNARSIAQVAELLLKKEADAGFANSNEGDWTMSQEILLNGFLAQKEN